MKREIFLKMKTSSQIFAREIFKDLANVKTTFLKKGIDFNLKGIRIRRKKDFS